MTGKNTRLKEAIARAGLTPAKVAAAVEVDAKTVERWVRGRTPYQVHRYAVAALLQVSEADLWPDDTARRPARFSFAGVCIWCERRGCTDSDCVIRHESALWEECSACGGAPWTRPGGCGCLYGLVQSAKFAGAGVA
ncbi:helix-turn-helix transcriptional regulator [Nocardia otitidiscaviarum]|uniref:helix-turn-helix transcriptional regulator n=1 Tax=Nocardia otitidiscaviarum TaxID=1823 RepID=UPI0018950C07|nr:helix-turn-helix transcriptional regulator [Nocardia otitidiscaviarum]MBF6238250.1 helix-turn-helix transcriptional regulator [Nocardia otitidiscaviarum]